MPQGLQIFDAAGALKLDVSDRTLQYITQRSYTFASGASSIAISIPGVVADGTWHVIVTATYHWAYITSAGVVTAYRPFPKAAYYDSGSVIILRG